jgi:hypothetical protein
MPTSRRKSADRLDLEALQSQGHYWNSRPAFEQMRPKR